MVLVFSDSHGVDNLMQKVLEHLHKDVTHLLHLGDGATGIRNLAAAYPEIIFEQVRGNCDSPSACAAEKIITIDGKKIWMLHGHSHRVKAGYQRIVYAAMEKQVDVCLFGHTHVPEVFCEGGVSFMNPGSISLPRDGGRPSYGVLRASEAAASVVLIDGDSFMSFEPK